jgi:spermidine synthase
MELWFTEEHTPNVRFSLKIKAHLYQEKTKFQTIDVIDTFEYGRMLLLDGLVMLTERDECAYHEMLTHIPSFTHPAPEKALVIGGGDGGTVRELLRRQSIRSIDLVEIDKRVVEISQQFFPMLTLGLDNPKVKLQCEDGLQFVKRHKNEYDVVLVDSFDPIGPAVGLFEEPFFKDVFDCMKAEGVMSMQCESTVYHLEVSKRVIANLRKLFPIVLPYSAFIPTYPSGQWLFILCSKKFHPLKDFQEEKVEEILPHLSYYNTEIHRGAFALNTGLKRVICNW